MLSDKWIIDRTPTTRFPFYTRGNAADVLADPVSPLGWTFCWESGIVLGCRDGFVTFGVFDEVGVATPHQLRDLCLEALAANPAMQGNQHLGRNGPAVFVHANPGDARAHIERWQATGVFVDHVGGEPLEEGLFDHRQLAGHLVAR